MRTTTVPAQVTTVEDKIVGEISLIQLLLLVAPVFGSAAIFVALPPFFASATYKIVIIVCLFVLFSTLAIRIKDRILLAWIMVLLRYFARPRYYLFDKNDLYLRDLSKNQPEAVSLESKAEVASSKSTPAKPTTEEFVRAEQVIANAKMNLHFRTDKKGVLRAYINEVQ